MTFYSVAKALLVLLCIIPCCLALNISQFQGNELVACAKLQIGYVYKDPSRAGGFGGLAIDYLRHIAENLHINVTTVEWKGTFTGLVDAMNNCSFTPNSKKPCPCHVAAGAFTVTVARAKKVNYISSFGNEEHVMISRLSDFQSSSPSSFWFIFRTFSPAVWGAIMIGIIVHTMGTILFVQVGMNQDDEDISEEADVDLSSEGIARFSTLCRQILQRITKLLRLVLFTYGTLLGHMLYSTTRGPPSLHRMAWILLSFTSGIFLLTVFQASLTVILFESRAKPSFRELSDITDCIVDPGRVAMIHGSASQDLWNKNINTSEFRNKCGWGRVGLTVSNLTHGFDTVLSRRVDYFYTLEGSVLYWANRNCRHFRPVGEPFFSTPVGFMMPKHADMHLLKRLSDETDRLREQNVFVSARRVAVRKQCDDVLDATISMQRVGSFFVLYAVFFTILVTSKFFSARSGTGERHEMRSSETGQLV